ncbi:HpcH/HpaI aldolase/citrate lyase family protein [Sphingomonas jatrophae]|uniref:Citrate lyase subunit beta / citryl-CoA lyase n=1 Tax=Sphingomonas jatrophae TaxID=1166337 RepID=A0A1I6KCE6_9SPHN|nr:CoA ester lyase [Sphingomonas jatrophae]SFR88913.1 citrate lyase subunit beta / citryl-CoA lyase [Sphingomonas jatrophae]
MPAPLDFIAPLFVPANRPERFAKAAASGADAVILDLEDAVAPADKATARAALAKHFTKRPVLVRINAAGTPWHEDDLDAVSRLPLAAIMLPKAERVADCTRIAAIHPVVALIETAHGIAAARSLATSGSVARIAFGSIDFAADLGCDHVREALAPARGELVLAARLGGLSAPLDGVTTALSDPAVTADDARHARSLGFGGKLLIHPAQVAPVVEAFRPSPDELDWARRVLASGDGVARVDGTMVDAPVRARARAIMARGIGC